MRKPLTSKEDETEEFREFWSGPLQADGTRDRARGWISIARPTDGRGDARDTFYQHVGAGADPQDIVDGARWFMINLKSRDREFVPLASSWLNKRAYEDGAESYRALQEQIAQRSENVSLIRQPSLPENHFSKRWERGEFKKKEA